MNVVIIGDRAAGKTSMVRALAENGNYVKVVDGQELASVLYDSSTKQIAGTELMQERSLKINVDMPATGMKQINLVWIDTPGEFWSNNQMREDYPSVWKSLEEKVTSSKAIILLLPPHSNLIKSGNVRTAANHLQPKIDFPTSGQWVTRLSWWLRFLEKCDYAKHILIGIHKADLFCNIVKEEKQWRYDPSKGGAAPWFDYNEYVLESYFGVANKEIHSYKSTKSGSKTIFFISSTESQDLLELPWLYLGPYIAYS
jgi:GTPase SAR1 family protein